MKPSWGLYEFTLCCVIAWLVVALVIKAFLA
jgi:hypothetical protein